MDVRHSSFALAALLGLASACHDTPGQSPEDGIGDTGYSLSTGVEDSAGTTEDTTSDETSGTGNSSDSTGEMCGGEVWEATSIASNMLIVQDRSGSMEEHIDDMTKWEIAQAAIEHVVTAYADEVFFGLMLYPGTDKACEEGMSCAPGQIFVDVGPGTGPEIIDVLGDSDTCNLGTPTAETLTPLVDYPGLQDLARPNYILLITDGQSNCGDPVPEVAALALVDPLIQTFVVGFGEGVDPDELNAMAEAGGTALLGDTKYYQANDAQALEDAFAEIANELFSCSYVLEQVPPNPDDLYIYIDDVLIERDVNHLNGWDYDPPNNRLTLYGMACEQLQSGEAQDLQILFGCPMVG